MRGSVSLVGAGPGDPELLTLKALRILQHADAVLHDDLVPPEILGHVPADARIVNVGKRCGTKKIRQEEINFLMISLAASGLRVVRLKSGDPMIFGRAGEEIEALRQAGVPYEIVPGITSALGAAASSQIPLTHRNASSAVVFITAHRAGDAERVEWENFVGSAATLVIYMPGTNYAEIGRQLQKAGLTAEVPCALIARATRSDEQTQLTTIEKLADVRKLPAPSLLVVGQVVRFAAKENASYSTGELESLIAAAVPADFHEILS